MSNTINIETTEISTENKNTVEVNSPIATPIHIPSSNSLGYTKKEYSIVGDGLYASVSADEAPAWLTGILDNVISARLDSSLGELSQANQSILNSLSELEVAKNEYQELINIDATVEGVVASRLSTLNATVDQNSATISSLQASKVDESQAIAIAGSVIEAELNSGSIGARIGNLDTAIANTNGALASSVDALEAQYDDISSATSELENAVSANADQAMANLSYGATLKLDYNGTDYYYSSGFGLKTTLAGGTESAPSGNSEFWVRADKARFVDSSDNLILEGDSQGLTFPGAGSIKSEGYDLSTNTGVFMGYNPTNLTASKYELMAGNGDNYMRWDGTDLKIKGDIELGTYNYWRDTGLFRVGDLSNYISWNGTSLTVKGNINLDSYNFWNVSNNRFRIGNSSNYLYWDGTDLHLSGVLMSRDLVIASGTVSNRYYPQCLSEDSYGNCSEYGFNTEVYIDTGVYIPYTDLDLQKSYVADVRFRAPNMNYGKYVGNGNSWYKMSVVASPSRLNDAIAVTSSTHNMDYRMYIKVELKAIEWSQSINYMDVTLDWYLKQVS